MKVWLLDIIDEECTLFSQVFSSQATAISWLASHCSHQWEAEGGDSPEREAKLNRTSAAYVVESYFDWWAPEQWYELTEMEVDPDV